VFPGEGGEMRKHLYLHLLHNSIPYKYILGKIRSVVTDGVTLGHPCCAGALDCKIPLANNKAMFCPHHEYKEEYCAVVSCTQKHVPNFKTCNDKEHRMCEEYYKKMGKAMFQLKSRLERNKTSQPPSSIPPNSADQSAKDTTIPLEDSVTESFNESEFMDLKDEHVLVGADGGLETNPPLEPTEGCPSKPETGNRKVRALFGRKRTHNEELCVASCGVILGRATFYGSEGANSIRVSLFNVSIYPKLTLIKGILAWVVSYKSIAPRSSMDGHQLRHLVDACCRT
jgi:hypothetical protein